MKINLQVFIKKLFWFSFRRSVPFCEERLSGSQREQFNDITAFVDASNVYGSDEGYILYI